MNLLKSLAEVSFVTILVRILGFARDVILARIFGAGISTDAFFIAFKLPNLLRRIFAEGAFSQAFIPILAEYQAKQCKGEIHMFISCISGLLVLGLAIVSFVGILGAPWVIMLTAPGFLDDEDRLSLTIRLLRITFPYIFFISLASLAGAVLNAWNFFIVPAFSPIFLNIAMISFAWFASSFFHPPVVALGWAVMLGGFLQLVYQLVYLKKIGMLALPRINFSDPGGMRVIKKMGPAILGVSVSQISLVINTIFASFLVSGSISWMYYADRLMEFPAGVLGAAIGVILLPSLSKSFVSGNDKEYQRLLDWGLRLCFLLGLPTVLAMGILSEPIVISLFQYDAFNICDSSMTKKSLLAYSVGLVGVILVKVLAQSFYSRQDVKTPAKIAVIILIATQLMNLVFVGPLKHAGLSLSIGISACINASLLYWKLRKKKIFIPLPGWRNFFIRVSISLLVMSISLTGTMLMMPKWELGTMPFRLSRLLAVVIVGACTYLGSLFLLGFKVKEFIYRTA